MQTAEIIKAWKDEDYLQTLTSEQLAELPKHPSGVVEFELPKLDDETLFGPAPHACSRGSCKIYSHYTKGNPCHP